MVKFLSVIFLVLASQVRAFSQGLEKVAPVLLKEGKPASGTSFLLTATDFSFFTQISDSFENSIQIIDADQPWPPRWFSTTAVDTSLGLPYGALIPLNASYQNQQFSFFSIAKTPDKNNKAINRRGFLLCNAKLENTSFFYEADYNLDHHDLKTKGNGEKLFFALHDTVMDLSRFYNSPKDTALGLSYEVIEIADSAGHTCFSWDPIKELGATAQYKLYRPLKGIWSSPNLMDWSHGNSLCFDYDGDILYSFKYIGIGKISRKDGHIIWRIDRNQPQANAFSDTIPIFLQHDFECVTDGKGNHFYTFLSNGDSRNKSCYVCQFTVKDTLNSQKIFRLKKKFRTAEEIPNTSGGGNYDLEKNGNYLVNYGTYKMNTEGRRTLFDYRDSSDRLLARYTVYPNILSYRVHKLTDALPPRPEIKKSKAGLTINSEKEATWFLLDDNNHTATFAGRGKNFKPSKTGRYCATIKYGIGNVVSLPVAYP